MPHATIPDPNHLAGKLAEQRYREHSTLILDTLRPTEKLALRRTPGYAPGASVADAAAVYGAYVAAGGYDVKVPEDNSERVRLEYAEITYRQRELPMRALGDKNGQPFKRLKEALDAHAAMPVSGAYAGRHFGAYKQGDGFVLRQYRAEGIGALDANWIDPVAARAESDAHRSLFADEKGLVFDKFGNMVTPEELDANDLELTDEECAEVSGPTLG